MVLLSSACSFRRGCSVAVTRKTPFLAYFRVHSVSTTSGSLALCPSLSTASTLARHHKPALALRFYSASSNDDSKKSNTRSDRTWSLLYHRSSSRSIYPRAMLGFSTINLSYWIWYAVDFTPAINASAQAKADLGQIDQATLDSLQIDPNMGYVGLTVAFLIWSGAVTYPRYLITAIWKSRVTGESEGNASLALSTLKLPFVTEPKVLHKTRLDPHDNNFDGKENIVFTDAELKSDSNVHIFQPGEIGIVGSKDINDLLVRFDGDFSKKTGHLALQKDASRSRSNSNSEGPLSFLFNQNWLLDIGSPIEIMPGANKHLLHSLLLKEYAKNEKIAKRGSPKPPKQKMIAEEETEKGDSEKANVGESILRKKGFRKRNR